MLPLKYPHDTPANDSVPASDAPVNSGHKATQQLASCSSASLQTAAPAAAAWPPSNVAVTAPQATLSQSATKPTVVASQTASRQDKPQHVLSVPEQAQPATLSADLPQPVTPQAAQPTPAPKSAAVDEDELTPAFSQRSEVQPATAVTVAKTGLAAASGADQPQLATSMEPQPQPAMAHVLDLLFPAEQLSLPISFSPLADSGALPALAVGTGQADAFAMDLCTQSMAAHCDVT